MVYMYSSQRWSHLMIMAWNMILTLGIPITILDSCHDPRNDYRFQTGHSHLLMPTTGFGVTPGTKSSCTCASSLFSRLTFLISSWHLGHLQHVVPLQWLQPPQAINSCSCCLVLSSPVTAGPGSLWNFRFEANPELDPLFPFSRSLISPV